LKLFCGRSEAEKNKRTAHRFLEVRNLGFGLQPRTQIELISFRRGDTEHYACTLFVFYYVIVQCRVVLVLEQQHPSTLRRYLLLKTKTLIAFDELTNSCN
jgi:hypothetical protein